MIKSSYLHSFLFLLLSISTLHSFAQAPKKGPRIRTIIIDAGHGGSDPGAHGAYSTEAQITLDIAQKLDTLLRSELPNTRIVMTRNTDVYNSPTEKANIANKENGDLFICIHVNASGSHKEVIGYKKVAYYKGKGKSRKKLYRKQAIYRSVPNAGVFGSSSYVWAADRGDEKAEALASENRFESEAEVVDVPDPESPEALIKARLWTQKFFKNSVRLGTMIENEFTNIGRKSLGVLQRNWKGIWVLQATNMPAVLIETGYITNPDEERYLTSEEGQNEMAQAIAKAILSYKMMIDGGR